MLELVVIGLIAMVAMALGYLTISEARDRSAYYFGAMAFLTAIWVPVSFLGNTALFPEGVLKLLTYADYFVGVAMLLMLYIFTLEVTSRGTHWSRYKLLAPLSAACLVGGFVVSGNVISVVVDSGGYARSVTEALYGVYAFYSIIILVVSFSALLRAWVMQRRAAQQDTIGPIVKGLAVAVVFSLAGSYLIPYLSDDRLVRTFGTQLTYFGLVVVLYFIWSGIYRFGLFSISQAAARASTYILSIAILLLFYVGLGFVVQAIFSSDQFLTTKQVLINVAVTIPSILLYPYAKQYFDRITNSLFFRDSYDVRAFFDQFNNILVTNIDTQQLLEDSRNLIDTTFTSEFVDFFILTTSYFENRSVGVHSQQLSDPEAEELRMLLPKTAKKLIYVEQVGTSDAEQRIAQILRNNDIAMLVRIVSNLDLNIDGIGWLLLGGKRSGKLYTDSDLSVLETAVNQLQLAAENALRFEEIQQFNITLQNKIDAATGKLKQSNKKLKALDEAKDEFISMASHQLRTPLTSVKGYASMLSDGDVGAINDGQKKMLGQILISSQRMISLIADLLNVSRLHTGTFVIERKSTVLSDVIETELEQIREGAEAKDIELVYEKPEHFPTMQLDETKTRQVVMNFIDNAIYYTPNGGVITIELKEKKHSIECLVHDTGIGVPKDQQHKLFTKFYRADNARRSRPDGTGLGLFMAKKVVVAQGGSIIFKSTEGKGSTFGFSVPKS